MLHLWRCEWARLRCRGSYYLSRGFSATTDDPGVESYRLLSYHRVTADGILVRPLLLSLFHILNRFFTAENKTQNHPSQPTPS